MLGNLERKGLVTRSPHPVHGHVVETRLSATGTALLRQADAAALRVEKALDRALGADLDRLRTALRLAATTLEDHLATAQR